MHHRRSFQCDRLADLDEDGRADLIAVFPDDGKIGVLIQGATGAFASTKFFPAPNHPNSVASADFDLDGNLDAVITYRTIIATRFWLGDGSGLLQIGDSYLTGANPDRVIAADLDGDGAQDWLRYSARVVLDVGDFVAVSA